MLKIERVKKMFYSDRKEAKEKSGFSGIFRKRKRYMGSFLKGFFQAGILGFLFYKSILIMVIFGTGYGICNIFREKKRFRKKQEKQITWEFREGLQGIASSLGAGYSIENAFVEARKDLLLLYGAESILAKEFLWIGNQLELNQPIEKVLLDFSDRWNTEDIVHFAQVFQTAKRTGGDLIAITHSTAEKIGQKIEVKREIQTMIAGKKMESRIMTCIPLGMILYFWICSPGFLDCFYTVSGRFVSTVLFVIYIAAWKWSERISDIKV